jgi:hypothetical protein
MKCAICERNTEKGLPIDFGEGEKVLCRSCSSLEEDYFDENGELTEDGDDLSAFAEKVFCCDCLEKRGCETFPLYCRKIRRLAVYRVNGAEIEAER